MRTLINKSLKGKIILPLFLSAAIVYTYMLIISIPKVMSFAGGMKILDMMPTGYTAGYAEQLMQTLGEEGRHAYLCNQIPADMIYPLLFGLSCCLILAYLLKQIGKFDGPLYYLCFIPIVAAIFDYLENVGIISMLKRYPSEIEAIAKTTSVFSVIKSFTTTAFFTVLIVLIIIWGIRKIQKR